MNHDPKARYLAVKRIRHTKLNKIFEAGSQEKFDLAHLTEQQVEQLVKSKAVKLAGGK